MRRKTASTIRFQCWNHIRKTWVKKHDNNMKKKKEGSSQRGKCAWNTKKITEDLSLAAIFVWRKKKNGFCAWWTSSSFRNYISRMSSQYRRMLRVSWTFCWVEKMKRFHSKNRLLFIFRLQNEQQQQQLL